MTTTATAQHKHRCMRCHEEFDCQTPGLCVAQYDVLPTIVTLGADGQPKLTEHCPHLAPKPAEPKTEAHTHGLTEKAPIMAELAHFNTVVSEYVAAVMSHDTVRHTAAAAALDRLAEQCAWDGLLLDYLCDWVDGTPVRLEVTKVSGARDEKDRYGATLYVEHTDHLPYGRHETVRDALKDSFLSQPASTPTGSRT